MMWLLLVAAQFMFKYFLHIKIINMIQMTTSPIICKLILIFFANLSGVLEKSKTVECNIIELKRSKTN
jgi:hypothetical protein